MCVCVRVFHIVIEIHTDDFDYDKYMCCTSAYVTMKIETSVNERVNNLKIK